MYLRNDLTAGFTKLTYPVTKFAGIEADINEESLPLSYGRYGYNVGFKNGSLVSAPGVSPAVLEGSTVAAHGLTTSYFCKMWQYKRFDPINQVRDDRLITAQFAGKSYSAPLSNVNAFTNTGTTWATRMNVEGLNANVNGEDVFIFYKRNGGYSVFNGTTSTASAYSPAFTSVTWYKGRVYGTTWESQKIYYSALNSYTNFGLDPEVDASDSGWLEIANEGGTPRKIIELNDYLYIFCDNTIYRYAVLSDFSEFRVTKVFKVSGMIAFDSIVTCGDKIYFVTDEGVYSFDGYIAKKVYRSITPLIEDVNNAVGCYYDFKYYLALRMKRDEYVVGTENDVVISQSDNNAVFIFDLLTGEITIMRGLSVGSFCEVSTTAENRLLIAAKRVYQRRIGMLDDSGMLYGTKLKKRWTSAESLLGITSKSKRLRKFFVSTLYPCTLKLTCNGQTVTKQLPSSLGVQTVHTKFDADRIKVDFLTESDTFCLSSFCLELETYKKQRYSV